MTSRWNKQREESVSRTGCNDKSLILSQRFRPWSPLTYWPLNQQGQSMFGFSAGVPEFGSGSHAGQTLQQPRQYFLQLWSDLETSLPLPKRKHKLVMGSIISHRLSKLEPKLHPFTPTTVSCLNVGKACAYLLFHRLFALLHKWHGSVNLQVSSACSYNSLPTQGPLS